RRATAPGKSDEAKATNQMMPAQPILRILSQRPGETTIRRSQQTAAIERVRGFIRITRARQYHARLNTERPDAERRNRRGSCICAEDRQRVGKRNEGHARRWPSRIR